MTAMTVSSGIGVLLLLLRPADTLWQPHAVFSRSVPPRHCRTTARAASTITSGNNTMAAGCTDAPARAAAEAETIASRSPSVPPAREPRDPRPPLTLAWSLVDGDPRHARLAPPAPHVSFGSLAAARDALAAVLLDERALAELAATQPPPTRVCGARVLRLDALLTCAETTTDGGTAEAAISWLQAQEGAPCATRHEPLQRRDRVERDRILARPHARLGEILAVLIRADTRFDQDDFLEALRRWRNIHLQSACGQSQWPGGQPQRCTRQQSTQHCSMQSRARGHR